MQHYDVVQCSAEQSRTSENGRKEWDRTQKKYKRIFLKKHLMRFNWECRNQIRILQRNDNVMCKQYSCRGHVPDHR